MRWSWLDEIHLVLIHQEQMSINSLESDGHRIDPIGRFRLSVDNRGFSMETRSRIIKKGQKV